MRVPRGPQHWAPSVFELSAPLSLLPKTRGLPGGIEEAERGRVAGCTMAPLGCPSRGPPALWTVPHRQKGFAEVMRVRGLEVGGQSWMVWLGPIAPCESQTAENLSWLWSEQEVTMEVGWGQRCEAAGLEDGHRGREPRNVGAECGFSPGASRRGGLWPPRF